MPENEKPPINPGIEPIHNQLDENLDEVLLRELKRKNPPAALLNVVRQRLKDLGIGKVPAPGSAAKEMVKECGLDGPDFQGGNLPEPCEDEEESA